MYYGAKDYYFWQGIEKGLEKDSAGLNELLDRRLCLGIPIVKECRKWALWGYDWGQALTAEEYLGMISVLKEQKPEPVVEPKEVKEPVSNIEQEYPFKGEC